MRHRSFFALQAEQALGVCGRGCLSAILPESALVPDLPVFVTVHVRTDNKKLTTAGKKRWPKSVWVLDPLSLPSHLRTRGLSNLAFVNNTL